MDFPSCDKRKTDSITGIPMCYAIGCYERGDMPCECWECLKSHGGKCPEGKDKCEPKAKKGRVMLEE